MNSPFAGSFRCGKVLLLSACAMQLACSITVHAEMRTWNLKSGATMEAEIVAFPSTKTIQVKRSDGKVYTLPESYLSDDDRSFVEAERTKQWKEVSVDKLIESVSGGRYKKCSVTGKEISGQILITMLPAQVEPILAKRQEQESQINALNNRVQKDDSAAHSTKSPNGTTGRRARYENKVSSAAASQDEATTKTQLTKLKADYDDYVKKTKPNTTLFLRNTGVAYAGLPVWECQTPAKTQ